MFKRFILLILVSLLLLAPFPNVYSFVKLFRSPGGAIDVMLPYYTFPVPAFYRTIIKENLYLNPFIYFLNKEKNYFNGKEYVISFYLENDDIKTDLLTLKKFSNIDEETEKALLSYLQDFKNYIFRNSFAFRILIPEETIAPSYPEVFIIKAYKNFERVPINYTKKVEDTVDFFYMIQDSIKIIVNYVLYLNSGKYEVIEKEGFYGEYLVGLVEPSKSFLDLLAKNYELQYKIEKKEVLDNTIESKLIINKNDYEFELYVVYKKDNNIRIKDIKTKLYKNGNLINYSCRTNDKIIEYFARNRVIIKGGYDIFWCSEKNKNR